MLSAVPETLVRTPTRLDVLRDLGWSGWGRAALLAVAAALVLGIPTDVVPNPVFGRPVPVRAFDVVILVVTAALIGLVFAVRPPRAASGDAALAAGEERGVFAGGLLSFFAVGCPVCNKLIVALLGTSGALAWFAPLQPLLGLAAVVMLGVTLRRRLDAVRTPACPLPG